MNDRFDLRIITQPHTQVYWGYFRRLVFGNSSTKHNKLTYFSNSMLFCSGVLLPFSHIPRLVQFSVNNVHKRGLKHHHFISHIPRCIHAKIPDFPRLFEPRENPIISFQWVHWPRKYRKRHQNQVHEFPISIYGKTNLVWISWRPF